MKVLCVESWLEDLLDKTGFPRHTIKKLKIKSSMMKQTNTIKVLALALAGIALMTGCQSVTSTTSQDIGAPTFAKTDSATVDILRTEPARPHERLGEIHAQTSSPNVAVSKIEDVLRKDAAKLGANAVVVVHDTTQVTGAQVVGGWLDRSIEETEGRVVIGIAIRYK